MKKKKKKKFNITVLPLGLVWASFGESHRVGSASVRLSGPSSLPAGTARMFCHSWLLGSALEARLQHSSVSEGWEGCGGLQEVLGDLDS